MLDPVKENIWELAEDALRAGWTPREVVNELSSAWLEAGKIVARDDTLAFESMLEGRA